MISLLLAPGFVHAQEPQRAGQSDSLTLKATIKKLTDESKEKLTRELKQRFNLIETAIQKPFSLDSVNLGADRKYLNADVSDPLMQSTQSGSANFHSKATIFSVPFDVRYQYRDLQFDRSAFIQQIPRVDFDAQAYMHKLKTALARKLELESLLPDQLQMLETIKKEWTAKFLQRMSASLAGLIKDSLLAGLIKEFNTPEALASLNKEKLMNKLIGSGYLQKIKGYETMLMRMQEQMNNGVTIDSAVLKIKDVAEVYRKIEKAVSDVMALKNSLQEAGAFATVRSMEKQKTDLLSQLSGDASLIKGQAKQKLSLSSLQKIFMYVSSLKTGTQGMDQSKLSMLSALGQNALSMAVSKNPAKSLELRGAKLPALTSVYEQAMSDPSLASVLPTVQSAGLTLGRNLSGSKGDWFTLMRYTSAKDLQSLVQKASSVSSFVFSYRKKIRIQNIQLSTEVSRSQTQYGSANFSAEDKPSQSKLFLQALAFSFEYEGEFKKAGITQQISFSKTGSAYLNPGNGYLTPGSIELSARSEKRFLDGKVTVTLRNQIRKFELTPGKLNTYQVHAASLRLKLPKGNSVQLTYQPIRSVQKNKGVRTRLYAVDRFSLQSNLRTKIAGLQYNHLVTGSLLSARYASLDSTGSRIIQINSAQGLQIGTLRAFVNTSYMYNRNTSLLHRILNASTAADAGIQYQWRSLQASTSLVYNDYTGVSRQLGVMQTLSATIAKNIAVNIDMTLGGNLRTYSLQGLPMTRADVTLHYNLLK
jgi:hypothetical protein